MDEIAPGVAILGVSIANVYFLGEPGDPWVLVDTGLPKSAKAIQAAAEERYGVGTRPEAIVLTHGHSDHAGSAFDLAVAWDAPIYAHPLERPYLTGRAFYPPADPTVGGAMAFLSRFFPPAGLDLRPRLQELPADGELPALPDWKWLFTPGHAPGHVSLYREADGVLLAGDAVTTTDVGSLRALLTKKQELGGPPSLSTADWDEARRSVRQLAALQPSVLACGHGVPMSGPDTAPQLTAFAEKFPVPAHGRYISEPARTDENGIVSLPRLPPDPLPRQIAVGLGLLAIAFGAFRLLRRR